MEQKCFLCICLEEARGREKKKKMFTFDLFALPKKNVL